MIIVYCCVKNIFIYLFIKFVKNVKDTEKEFHTRFPGLKIIHAQDTRRGSLLIELEPSSVAETVVQNRKPQFFSSDNGISNKTIAALLKDKNCKGILHLHPIDHDYSDDYIVIILYLAIIPLNRSGGRDFSM